MAYLSPSAHVLLSKQHGVVSLQQLEGTGLTRSQIEHLVQTGSLVNATRGAYRTPSVQDSELVRCTGLCVSRPNIAICGVTAGRLWGFRQLIDDRRIHIVAPPGSQPAAGDRAIVTHRTDSLTEDAIIRRGDGIRLTSRARTVMDLMKTHTSSTIQSILEQAMHDGRLGPGAMQAPAVGRTHRRPWVRDYLHLIDGRLGGGAAESDPEVRVGTALREHGVVGLVRQFSLELPGHRRVRFDLAVPRFRWAIEVDVFPTHQETTGRADDLQRDAMTAATGWTTSRVTRDRYHTQFSSSIVELVERYRLFE